MKIESLNSYIAALEAQATLARQGNLQESTIQTKTTNSTDSYEASSISSTSPLPSDTYGNIIELVKASKQAKGESEGAPTEEDFQELLEELTEVLEQLEEATDSSTI